MIFINISLSWNASLASVMFNLINSLLPFWEFLFLLFQSAQSQITPHNLRMMIVNDGFLKDDVVFIPIIDRPVVVWVAIHISCIVLMVAGSADIILTLITTRKVTFLDLLILLYLLFTKAT